MGVISKVDYPDWVVHTMYVKKKYKKIRVCSIFLTRLNDCLKDPLPSAENIFFKLNDGNVFSKIDLSEAYLQVKVDKECSKLLTVNTRKGLFKLNRLSFRLKFAPSLFQQVMSLMLAGLEFATAYLDEILL